MKTCQENQLKNPTILELLRIAKLENQFFFLGKNLISRTILVNPYFQKNRKQGDFHTWP
jgi:hypothetical protein